MQIDETAFAKFGDPDVQAALAERGEDWRQVIDLYIAVTNRILRAAPKDMRIGMHLCRGNRGGLWHSQGSYDAVADKLFNALEIGFYFLEYDMPRAGTFTPLRLVPKDKSVVLGLVSTKNHRQLEEMNRSSSGSRKRHNWSTSNLAGVAARNAVSPASMPAIR